MKLLTSILLMASAVACAPVTQFATPAERIIPSGPEPEGIDSGYDRAAIERDLLATARNRVGETLVRRALAADSYIFAKYYPGMVPPPPPGAGASWRPAPWPFALLFEEKGLWFAATPTGARAANPSAIAGIQALLADPAFWRQPHSTPPRCTDAGASLLMIKLPRRGEKVLRGSCGETERTQRLVLLARDG